MPEMPERHPFPAFLPFLRNPYVFNGLSDTFLYFLTLFDDFLMTFLSFLAFPGRIGNYSALEVSGKAGNAGKDKKRVSFWCFLASQA